MISRELRDWRVCIRNVNLVNKGKRVKDRVNPFLVCGSKPKNGKKKR